MGTTPPAHPIIDVRNREQALLHAQKLEAIGAFATGITHDFSNVLQVIVGIADLVSTGQVAADRVPEMMQRLAAAARHGTDLVRQLMAFTRKQTAVPRPIDLAGALIEAVRMIERLLPRNIRVELALATSTGTVLADPVQIEQVLINLGTNARDAMPRGGTLSIASDVVEPSGVIGARRYVRVTVRDTGCGMTAAVRARIFEPFFTTKDAGRGTGLGLATIATIMRQLDGSIDIDSEPGRGTTFTLHFPCTTRKSTSPVTPTVDALDATVLVIEQDPVVRQTIRGYLISAGADVLEAAHSDEAFALLGAADAIVSEAEMPTLTGAQLCALVREHLTELPVLLTSTDDHARLLASSVVPVDQPFLRKPFTRDQLIAMMGDLLARSRAPAGPRVRRIPPLPRSGSTGRHP